MRLGTKILNNKEILNNSSQFICVGDVCLGRY